MTFPLRTAAILALIGATLWAGAVRAQLGNVFTDAPPRPPADVPNGPFPPQPPPVQYPGQYPAPQQYPAQQYPAPQQYPARQNSPPQTPVARAPAAIQAQPLPPPPGAAVAPTPVNRSPAPAAPASEGAPNQPPQPTATAAPPDQTVVTETPTEKIENGRAVFAGLDKITGRTISFDAAIGETVQFGALQVTARACYTRPPTEPTNTDAFVEVEEVTLQGEIKRIFTGWMFASSPGLNAVEHPIYDVWLTGCEAPQTGAVAASTPPPSAPAGTAPQARPRQAPPNRQPVAAPKPAAAPLTDD